MRDVSHLVELHRLRQIELAMSIHVLIANPEVTILEFMIDQKAELTAAIVGLFLHGVLPPGPEPKPVFAGGITAGDPR